MEEKGPRPVHYQTAHPRHHQTDQHSREEEEAAVWEALVRVVLVVGA